MPTTVAAAVIMIVLLAPGILGEAIYSRAIRSDPAEKDVRVILRIILVSVLGLMAYVYVAHVCGLPDPVYLFPDSYKDLALLHNDPEWKLFVPYVGHMFGGILVGMVAVPCSALIRFLYQQPRYDSAWDAFCLLFAQTPQKEGRWVQVQLADGRHVLGILSGFDAYAKKGDRDIILQEPEYWDDDKKVYVIPQIQSLYLPASQITAISVAYDKELDARVTEVPEYEHDGQTSQQEELASAN